MEKKVGKKAGPCATRGKNVGQGEQNCPRGKIKGVLPKFSEKKGENKNKNGEEVRDSIRPPPPKKTHHR